MYTDPINVDLEARRCLRRILPGMESKLAGQIAADPQMWVTFKERLGMHLPALFRLYHHLYARRYDFFYHFENLLYSLAWTRSGKPSRIGFRATRWWAGSAMWICLQMT